MANCCGARLFVIGRRDLSWACSPPVVTDDLNARGIGGWPCHARKVEIVNARKIQSVVVRLIRDESGAEVMEYVLIAGLIIVGTIATIAGLGTKVLGRWTSVKNSSL